jgi:hypothetical protein
MIINLDGPVTRTQLNLSELIKQLPDEYLEETIAQAVNQKLERRNGSR